MASKLSLSDIHEGAKVLYKCLNSEEGYISILCILPFLGILSAWNSGLAELYSPISNVATLAFILGWIVYICNYKLDFSKINYYPRLYIIILLFICSVFAIAFAYMIGGINSNPDYIMKEYAINTNMKDLIIMFALALSSLSMIFVYLITFEFKLYATRNVLSEELKEEIKEWQEASLEDIGKFNKK